MATQDQVARKLSGMKSVPGLSRAPGRNPDLGISSGAVTHLYPADFLSFIVTTRAGVLSPMRNAARLLGRVLVVGVFAVASACFAADKPRIEVNDYIIHVAVTPQTHQLKA